MTSPREPMRNVVTGMTLRIVRSAEETGGDLLEMEASYPGGSPAPPAHFHPSQEERFVVLEGTMRAVVSGVERDLAPGDTLLLPPGTVHSMWNPGPGLARVSWISTPALRTEQFFTDLFALAAAGRVNAGGRPGLLDLAALMSRYAPEIRVAKPPPVAQRVVFGVLGQVARLAGRGRRPD